jgi:hypothetical protein
MSTASGPLADLRQAAGILIDEGGKGELTASQVARLGHVILGLARELAPPAVVNLRVVKLDEIAREAGRA